MTETAAPHLQDGQNSSLAFLARQALRRFGDFSTDTVDSATALMMIEFANMVVDEILRHPYWDDELRLKFGTPTHYEALDDIRRIPDSIIIAGLFAHYSIQQGSQKSQVALPMFYRTLNGKLYELRFGNGPIAIKTPDKTSMGYIRR